EIEILNSTKTKTSLSTALHLQTDGQGETLNRTVEEMLRHYVAQQPEKWDETLTPIKFAYNNSILTPTDFSPFCLDAGRHPRITEQLTYSITPQQQLTV
ncbi:unnamed protein product, partial [Didymodactylos carnosus]